MGKSIIQTGASLILKTKIDDGASLYKTVGFVEAIDIVVTNGQRAIMVIDTPFPVEIAQGAGKSSVRGTMIVYMLKGTTLEASGLVPSRTEDTGKNLLGHTKAMDVGIFDRLTDQLLYTIESMKVAQYSMSIKSRSVVKVSLQFEGVYFTPNSQV